MLDAMRWWVFWNNMGAQHATKTFRLEDLNPELFANLLEMIGADPDTAGAAFASVDRDVNSSTRRGTKLTGIEWSDLPAGREKDDLERAAARFGYVDLA
ncbi:hypothetical protein GCM10010531_38900 [Blastococcus jejuensis]|uniref:Uncharacterized protein n=1 Tax=Blastococcus jejuensis TaxID=351224 RepID=A0ABP6PKQ3_9ACTN